LSLGQSLIGSDRFLRWFRVGSEPFSSSALWP